MPLSHQAFSWSGRLPIVLWAPFLGLFYWGGSFLDSQSGGILNIWASPPERSLTLLELS